VIFEALEVGGAFLIRPERRADSRGFFARTWCAREALAQGLDPSVSESTIWVGQSAGAVRELSYQVEPHERSVVVRCTRGMVHCSLLDLRPVSPSFERASSVVLDAENGHAVYVPAGVAHGFQSLRDRTEVLCQASAAAVQGATRRISPDDPLVVRSWPLPVSLPA
jgi:dTDP-4-dehydrorhamnose 3,5-epimerase